MSYDIYGDPLRRGHCEVHPHVREEYPCSVCVAESRRQQEAQIPAWCDGNPAHCESAHYLGQAQEEIKRLNDEVQALRKDAGRMRRNTLLAVLGELNSNPYNLTKSECIDVVREMFEEADAAMEKQK